MLLVPCRIHGAARRRARVEIIPLIDVIFFLLATFVLFTLSLSLIRALPVALPYGGKSEEKSEPVTLLVSGEGAIYWNRELIDRAEVPARLAVYKTGSDNPRVVVAGDDRARFGAAIALVDELRAAGITQFTVETRTRRAGQ